MRLDRGAPPAYLVGHLEEALARDARVVEQGLRVAIEGEPAATVVVTGTLTAPGRRRAIAEVIGDLLPGVAVRDETAVADYPEPPAAEDVP